MAVDNVPWFVGAAGVEHSAELARIVAYGATGGNSGVAGATDGKITAMGTPGGNVVISPGTVVMTNRYPGGEGQSYVGWIKSSQYIPVGPNNTNATRHDMVIARIRDPQYATYAGFNANSPNGFNFFDLDVVQDVQAGTRRLAVNYPHAVLARIAIPPNTSAITNAMITDLRNKVNAQKDVQVDYIAPSGDRNLFSSWRDWPSSGAPTAYIPEWATEGILIMHASGVQITGPVSANYRARLGSFTDPQLQSFHKSDTGKTREAMTLVGKFAIPKEYRGLSATYAMQAMRTSSVAGGNTQLDLQSTIVYELHFRETAE